MTLWDSLEAVRAFAGTNMDKAVVESGARAILSRCDGVSSHYTVVIDTMSGLGISSGKRTALLPPTPSRPWAQDRRYEPIEHGDECRNSSRSLRPTLPLGLRGWRVPDGG
jgi:hypothetical protein